MRTNSERLYVHVLSLVCFLVSTSPVSAQKVNVELTAGKLLEETTYPSVSSNASIAIGYTFYRGASIWGGTGLYVHEGGSEILPPNYSWYYTTIRSIPLSVGLRYTVGSVSRANLSVHLNGSLLPSTVERGYEGVDTKVINRFRARGGSLAVGWGVSLKTLDWLRFVGGVKYEYARIPLNGPYQHVREGIRIDAGVQLSPL